MTYNAARTKARATRLLSRTNKVKFTLTYQLRADQTNYDPITGDYTGSPTTVQLYGVMTPPTTNYILRVGADQLQKNKENQVIYAEAGPGLLPEIGDLCHFGGDDWTVQRAERLSPDGTDVLWTMLVWK